MVNILGQEDSDIPYAVEGVHELLSVPGVKLHLYGKKRLRLKRKLGHITVVDRTVEGAMGKAERARHILRMIPEKQIQ